MQDIIDFSKTDYGYITRSDTDEIASVLIKLADEKISDFYDDIENCLFYLKTICQNSYNDDFYRKMLYILTKISMNNNLR